MKFDLKRRPAEFGIFRNRREKETDQSERGKLKAIDLPVRIQIKPTELDMLVPTNGVPLSTFLFGPDLRKPELQVMLLSPLKVFRKPEHLRISIYDDGVDKRKVITFNDCRVEKPQIEFDESTVFLTFKVEIHPGNQLQRISDNVEGQIRDFECKAMQPELFDAESGDEDEEDGEDAAGGEQTSLMEPPDGDGDADDEGEGEDAEEAPKPARRRRARQSD